jgi:UDP-N-acetylglucosamine pyrophosphorylase
MKSLDILKKESAKVKGCYGKAAKRVIAFFRQSVYYNYNRVKFGEFEHVRKRADKID